MGILDLVFESLPGAPGGGLGPGGTFIGGVPALGGNPGESAQPGEQPTNDEPFFNPKKYRLQETLEQYHKWLTSSGSAGGNAARTVTAVGVLPVLFILFHLERSFRSPLL